MNKASVTLSYRESAKRALEILSSAWKGSTEAFGRTRGQLPGIRRVNAHSLEQALHAE